MSLVNEKCVDAFAPEATGERVAVLENPYEGVVSRVTHVIEDHVVIRLPFECFFSPEDNEDKWIYNGRQNECPPGIRDVIKIVTRRWLKHEFDSPRFYAFIYRADCIARRYKAVEVAARAAAWAAWAAEAVEAVEVVEVAAWAADAAEVAAEVAAEAAEVAAEAAEVAARAAEAARRSVKRELLAWLLELDGMEVHVPS